MKREPVAKRTRAQTERRLWEELEFRKKIRQEKWEAESPSSKIDDVAVSFDAGYGSWLNGSNEEIVLSDSESSLRLNQSDDDAIDDTDDVDDNEDDEDGGDDEESETDDESLLKLSRKNKGKLKKSTKIKHNRVLKHNNVQSILLNSILIREESCESTLPEISEESPLPVISEEESDPLSPIWTEMEFSLKASEICSSDTLMQAENEVVSSHEVEIVEAHCQQGNHDLILDEEYGLCCKHCNYVKFIRDVDPPFTTSPCRRSEWREFNNVGPSFFDDLHSNDPGFNSLSDCDAFSQAQGTVWDLVPGGVRQKMFPHQREGFEFIWNNIAGGINLEELNSNSVDGGNGCIISHAPGTGKTGLTIVFLQSYMKLHPRCKPVIIAPCSMLLTWEEEFLKWRIDIPFHNLNKPELSGEEMNDAVSLLNNTKHGGRRAKLIRLVKLYSWKKDRGILGVSYRLFDKLVNNDELSGILLDLPGLFVFDEGHTPRNDDSGIFKALCRIKTKRRIILSGTPFQNNFQELENTLSLVRQEFGEVLHTVRKRKRGRKRNDAKCASLISSIGRGADSRDGEKLKKLKEKIAPFVHLHKGKVLQESLPGLRHTVVVLQPDQFQESLCKSVEGLKNTKSFVELDYCISLISVHPSLFPKQCIERFDIDWTKLRSLKLDPKAGIKTRFLLILLQLSQVMNEKVLVFSQYIEPLSLIMMQLKHSLNWREGIEILYMDGKQDMKKRQSLISFFNNLSSDAKILLASTKASCEGINLVGASRVVLLDVVWNPSVERQAISRAYRLGQKRLVHVYHLIISGTLEGDKLCRQARKVWWSNMVFPSPDGGDNQISASEPFEDKLLEEMAQHGNMIKDIIPQHRESELIETFGEFLDKQD